MMNTVNQELVEIFCLKSKVVGSKIFEAASFGHAIDYILTVCDAKAPCEILAPEAKTSNGPLNCNNIPTRLQKIIAAPRLNEALSTELATACANKNYSLIDAGMRNYLAGVDIGIAEAELGIAASGTCMLNSESEDVRLASMICEIGVILLKKSQIYPDLPSIAPILRAAQSKNTSAYTAFISGPSRTADIERIPAIGVHGPLEQHIILLEG